MRKVIVFSILIIIPVLLFAAFLAAHTASSAPLNYEVTGVGAAWYDPDWHYRRPVTVTNSSSTLTNYQVLVKLDAAFDFNHAQTDGDDLRVTASDGTTPLSFWVESWDNAGTKAWVWVKMPSLPTGKTILYLYYGNDSAASASDGAATFEAYDGYENYIVGTVPTRNYYNPGEWTRYAGNPVLQGTAGTWDGSGATFASVISDSGTYSMYYHGWGTGCTGTCIGLATSMDGQTWTKYAGNPVMRATAGAWDASGVRVPMVWKEGANDYRMIYTGSHISGTVTIMQTGYATSTNGIDWYKSDSNPVFNDPTWAHNSTQNWGVIKVGSKYLMWYEDQNAPRESGIVTSTNLINWTPYASNPIFATSGTTSDDRYSQFSPFTFKYGGYYYVLVSSYSSVSDYAQYYLYRSTSPYFPTGDRQLVRVAHTVGIGDQWDALDSDTPAVLTSDIERSIFPGSQLWTYYAGVSAGGPWSEGLLIETGIATALTDAALPYGVSWVNTNPISMTVVSDPVRQGLHSLRFNDTGKASISSRGTFAQMTQGEAGVWVRRTSSGSGGTDLYVYGNGPGDGLAVVGGLGGTNRQFHYWSRGTFYNVVTIPITQWSVDTWYYVSIVFNIGTNTFDFVVYDTNMTQVARANGIAMWRLGTPGTYVNSAMVYTDGTTYIGRAYWDDYRIRKYVLSEPTTAVRSYSDIQEQVQAAGSGPLTFNYTGIGMDITTYDSSLTSVQIIRYFHFHPSSPFAQQPYVNQYWEIIPNDGASGYTANLTLPHPRIPDDGDKVCFFTGAGWDCEASSVDPENATITRAGIMQFSEWTTQDDLSPLAVTLKNFTASPQNRPFISGLLAAGLVSLLAAGLLWRCRVRLHK